MNVASFTESLEDSFSGGVWLGMSKVPVTTPTTPTTMVAMMTTRHPKMNSESFLVPWAATTANLTRVEPLRESWQVAFAEEFSARDLKHPALVRHVSK